VRTPVETAAVLDEMTRTSPPARLGGAAGRYDIRPIMELLGTVTCRRRSTRTC
jgi:hypothetical protein